MALGGALSEELEFADGKLLNLRFSRYRVPRFRGVPRIKVRPVENRDIPPAEAARHRSLRRRLPSPTCLRRHRGAPALDAPARKGAAEGLMPRAR
jgi:hypothetical protein